MIIKLITILISVCMYVNCNNDFPSLAHIKTTVSEETQTKAVEDLIVRLIPDHAHNFAIIVDSNLSPNGKDVFHLEKLGGGVVEVRASTGVAAATGFHHYLKYYCSCHISWEASNLNLPSELPSVNVTVAALDMFRYYQNVCTASYSFVWWDWSDWEKHIDWMVLNSYNLVLSLTGVEAIWKRVYTTLNLTKEEIDAHFPGPAFLAWGRMGNIRGWGGPLPDSWHKQSVELQHQILTRMRNFGIVPVLPAFSGHVPVAFKRLFPNAQMTKTPRWNKFNDTYCCPYLLDPTDPLFKTIGTMFMEELIHEFGTNHVYSCDTFNEMLPDNDSVSYIHAMGKSVYSAMASYDAKAIWVMQNWLFVHELLFWTEERVKALLTSVPTGKMIVLDLQSEQHPQYVRLNSYYGQPYIWCMLHDFGGTLGMFGSADIVNKGVSSARSNINGTMIGTGLTPEGINQNYVVYDLMTEASWRSAPTDLSAWFSSYATRRYARSDESAIKAWQLLKDTVYNYSSLLPIRGKYVLTRKPSTRIIPWTWYDPCDLLQAWNFLLESAVNLRDSDAYRHDLTDLTRQVLQVLGDHYYKKIKRAFKSKDYHLFQNASATFLEIFTDLEETLLTNRAFLLGNWLKAAKRAASNSDEEKLYEYNARNQITLWGPNGEISDYANKQWSGMIYDYYYRRWALFLRYMDAALYYNVTFNEAEAARVIFKEMEEPFTFSRKIYPDYPSGDIISVAQHLREKWWKKQHCRFARDEYAINLFESRPTVIMVQ